MAIIYIIINNINHKVYIGQTIDIKRRWHSHIYDLRNNNHINIYLQRAWNKYGENNFEFKILEEISDELLNEKEKYWINFYKSFDREYGYNLTTGGDNFELSNEVKDQISQSMKGKSKSKSHRQNLSNSRIGVSPSNKGKKMSEEQKEKIRKTFQEKHPNKGQKAWNKGLTKNTDERVKKYCETQKLNRLNK